MQLKPSIASSMAGFLFDPATGDSFAANPLAADILDRTRAGQEEEAIKADILAHYDVAPAQLEKDWDDLLAQLRDFNLLAPVA
ncbi:MAG: PqqD family protein [Bacteroidota bacterium]|nr:PqqD family protein [Bacteroidota bacterium]